MAEAVHLVVESGEDRGMRFAVPVGGARLGRSSKNDFVLSDPLLSRHHCRFFFKPDDGLWLSDLGSANHTLVNGQTVQDAKLNAGDLVQVGDTVIRVLLDRMTAPPAEPGAENAPGDVDLGLRPETEIPRGRARPFGRLPLIIVAILVLALAAAAWLPRFLRPPPAPRPPPPRPEEALELRYEKVVATANDIYRCEVIVEKGGAMSVHIDDTESRDYFHRRQDVSAEILKDLRDDLVATKFFDLPEEFRGVQPHTLDQWDLCITVGKRTHRTTVVNRVQPEIFKNAVDLIEKAAVNEFKLQALQRFSPEKRREMARDVYLLGKDLYAARNVQNDNLWKSIKSFEECDWYLETIEPKPDYYADMLKTLTDCRSDLKTRHEDLRFQVARAQRLGDWREAAQLLRALLEVIPDRQDPRHDDAKKELMQVELRLDEKH